MTEHELRSRRPLPGVSSREGDYFVSRWRGTAVMAIINVTPDSFSDGGDLYGAELAVEHGKRMAASGATFLDVGGESTRPGAQPVPADIEAERILPVVTALARGTGALISVDTRKPEVARAAIEAGAHLVNDVGGLRDPQMLRLVAEAGVPAVAMHMQGEPRTMQENPSYVDVVAEVGEFLRAAQESALAAGVPDVIIDPGIGFGKNLEHNLALLRSLNTLTGDGAKLLVGASRKRTIAALAGEIPPRERDPGSLAIHLHAASAGAAIVRAHDAAGHVQALRVWEGIRG